MIQDDAHESAKESAKEKSRLDELLHETRILLPGTEIFLSLLLTIPFTQRFDQLSRTDRTVYLCTFFSTLVAFVCFVVPAAYHRIARPLRHKARFKVFANVFLVIGLVPMSLALVLVAYLVGSVAGGSSIAFPAAAVVGVLVGSLWWLMPILRLHDRYPADDPHDARRSRPPTLRRSTS